MIQSQNTRPYVEIIEQPAGRKTRFRYKCKDECEVGSIPGINSKLERRTFPSIRIVGYEGRAVVMVSCVTEDKPYRSHPHSLVGKNTCTHGVCTIQMNVRNSPITFHSLEIERAKKKEIAVALTLREEIQVDPYENGFQHKNQFKSINLNAVRLCFQVYLEGPTEGKFSIPLHPVVSDPIYDNNEWRLLLHISRYLSLFLR